MACTIHSFYQAAPYIPNINWNITKYPTLLCETPVVKYINTKSVIKDKLYLVAYVEHLLRVFSKNTVPPHFHLA